MFDLERNNHVFERPLQENIIVNEELAVDQHFTYKIASKYKKNSGEQD